MTTTTADSAPQSSPVPFTRLLGQAMLGGVFALAGNLILYFGGLALGVPYTAEFQPGAVTAILLPAIVASSFLPGVIGSGVAFAFQKFTAQPARNFAILAGLFTLVSLGGPANLKQIGTGTLVAMELMHVVTALGIGGALYRALRK